MMVMENRKESSSPRAIAIMPSIFFDGKKTEEEQFSGKAKSVWARFSVTRRGSGNSPADNPEATAVKSELSRGDEAHGGCVTCMDYSTRACSRSSFRAWQRKRTRQYPSTAQVKAWPGRQGEATPQSRSACHPAPLPTIRPSDRWKPRYSRRSSRRAHGRTAGRLAGRES